MKQIKMWECSDGQVIRHEGDAQKHEDDLTRKKEVDDFLDVIMSKAADHTKKSKREVLLPMWDALRDYFTHDKGPIVEQHPAEVEAEAIEEE